MYPNYVHQLPRSYIMGTLIRRREDPQYVTELSDEEGTTIEAIGDATAEFMKTTMGEIPEEMYDFSEMTEDTFPLSERTPHSQTINEEKCTDEVSGFAAHSTLFTFLLVTLLVLILICCISACVIAKARKKHLDSSCDMECHPDCREDAKQPLINCEKMSDSTSRSSCTDSRH